jgi:hypothetical protein
MHKLSPPRSRNAFTARGHEREPWPRISQRGKAATEDGPTIGVVERNVLA